MTRTPRALALAASAVFAVVALAACTPPQGESVGGASSPTATVTADATATAEATVTATPTGSAIVGIPEGVEYAVGLPTGVTDPPAEAVAGAGWSTDGSQLYVTVFGSSSCPTVATGFEATGSTVTVELAEASGVVCTADFVPTTTTLNAPGLDLDGTAVDVAIGDLGTAAVPAAADPISFGWVLQPAG